MDASRPADRLQQQNDEIIGIASDALTCLAASDNPLVPRVGEVKLNWEGQAEQAHLIVTVSGAEAAHTIKINGQPVAQTPIHPGGQLCGDGEESQSFYLNIPVSTLVQGNNRIELTNDAQSDDSWSAGHVRLIVSGKLVLDIPDAGQIGPENIIAAASVFTASFPNTYDGSSQQFMGQIPTSYDPDIATPLFVAVHGRSGGMDNGVNAFGTEANNRGWLLASPELHGNWPSSSSPQPPNPGAYAYASVQAQYDIVGAVTYMVNNYNVDPNRIYLYGTSMGAMTGAVTVAKF
ncbi:MAG TPA: hypothetical protein VEC93_24270, partial [Anaerolineae bacterium]|nr:hypothetical protein [Anaerolineae bacterium]